MKFENKILLIPVLVFICCTTVEARQIRSFNNFAINGRTFERTDYLTKENNYGYVLNLNPCRDLSPNKVRFRLVNSNGQVRSNEYFLECGQRGAYADWATPGYIYALEMKRENFFDFTMRITGSWSPDE